MNNMVNTRQGRRWLEILIEELTFVSSLDQAATAVVNARVHLQNNPILAAVPSDLEDLIFHRLGREWHERQSLTMMLEQVQLAHSLGIYLRLHLFLSLSFFIYLFIYYVTRASPIPFHLSSTKY